jgi:hypothetical protein
LAGEGTFECDEGGWEAEGHPLVWDTTLPTTFAMISLGTEEVLDGGDGGAPGPKDGIAVGILLVLGLGCAKGPEEGAGRV